MDPVPLIDLTAGAGRPRPGCRPAVPRLSLPGRVAPCSPPSLRTRSTRPDVADREVRPGEGSDAVGSLVLSALGAGVAAGSPRRVCPDSARRRHVDSVAAHVARCRRPGGAAEGRGSQSVVPTGAKRQNPLQRTQQERLRLRKSLTAKNTVQEAWRPPASGDAAQSALFALRLPDPIGPPRSLNRTPSFFAVAENGALRSARSVLSPSPRREENLHLGLESPSLSGGSEDEFETLSTRGKVEAVCDKAGRLLTEMSAVVTTPPVPPVGAGCKLTPSMSAPRRRRSSLGAASTCAGSVCLTPTLQTDTSFDMSTCASEEADLRFRVSMLELEVGRLRDKCDRPPPAETSEPLRAGIASTQAHVKQVHEEVRDLGVQIATLVHLFHKQGQTPRSAAAVQQQQHLPSGSDGESAVAAAGLPDTFRVPAPSQPEKVNRLAADTEAAAAAIARWFSQPAGACAGHSISASSLPCGVRSRELNRSWQPAATGSHLRRATQSYPGKPNQAVVGRAVAGPRAGGHAGFAGPYVVHSGTGVKPFVPPVTARMQGP
eukprot:TRINITY_DN23252_c0_g1_i1.p1 TRINITY_DN23252_c0_g1~~TRINITY_DN23252_c0_g1_i1.p1  ORF type:complete len:563 (-),score=75.57 TRINITY_DN23252_c0_g1_i1:137-1774(-)